MGRFSVGIEVERVAARSCTPVLMIVAGLTTNVITMEPRWKLERLKLLLEVKKG